MNPPAGEEEEKKKKKKNNGFWRKKNKKKDMFLDENLKNKKKDMFSDENLLEAFSRIPMYDNTRHDSAAMTPIEEAKMILWCATEQVPEEEKDVSFCTAICDFMFCLPRSQYGFFGEGLDSKVMAGLKECENPDHRELAGDVLAIDLRGQHAYTAMKSMRTYLLDSSTNPELKYLKVRVGCTKHGVGKGKLKQAVIDVFQYDASINVDYEEDNGTVISIELDSTKDYRCLGPFWIPYLEDCGPFDLLRI